MQQRNLYGGFDLRGDLVHGVGAEKHEIGPGSLNLPGRCREDFSCGLPITLTLQSLNRLEINAVQGNFGRVQTAESPGDAFIDGPIIIECALPAHAT